MTTPPPNDHQQPDFGSDNWNPPNPDTPNLPGAAQEPPPPARAASPGTNPPPASKQAPTAAPDASQETGLAPMAQLAHNLAEQNPLRTFRFIPLLNKTDDWGNELPGEEGKIPFTPNWQTTEPPDLEDPQWKQGKQKRDKHLRTVTGYGVVLTDNRWLFIIDIDNEPALTAEQKQAVENLPTLTYRTRKGRHYLMAVPPTAGLPEMNSRTQFGGPWGELFHHAPRQVALCGSANKELPDNLTIPDADILQVKETIRLLTTGPSSRQKQKGGKEQSRHDALKDLVVKLRRQGLTNEDIRAQAGQTDAYKKLDTDPKRNAPEELRKLIRWAQTIDPNNVDIPPPPDGADPALVKKAREQVRKGITNENLLSVELSGTMFHRAAIKEHGQAKADELLTAIIDWAVENCQKHVGGDDKPLPLGDFDVQFYVQQAQDDGFLFRANHDRTSPYIYNHKTGTWVTDLTALHHHIRDIHRGYEGSWRNTYLKETEAYIRLTAPTIPLQKYRTWTSFTNGDYNSETFTFHTDRSPDRNIVTHIPRNYHPDQKPDYNLPLWQNLRYHYEEHDLTWLLWLLGQHLLGYNPGLLPILTGEETMTFKSSTVLLLDRLVGEDLSCVIELEELMRGGDRAAQQRAKLKDALLASCADLDEFDIASLGALKSLTGGDKLLARRLYQDATSFYNQALIIGTANQPPRTGVTDQALRRRLRFIHLNKTITTHKNERHIDTYTDTELDQLFTASLLLAAKQRKTGQPEPTQSELTQTYTEEYWQDQDWLTQAIHAVCFYDQHSTTRQSVIRARVQEKFRKYDLDQPVPSQKRIIPLLHKVLPKITSGNLLDIEPPEFGTHKGHDVWHRITVNPGQ